MAETQSYFSNIKNSVTSVFEGMAVTMSWMFRKPSTVQYPFHPSNPSLKIGGPETLPDRYRGFLEVDMDICTACLACERACPIDCIKIDVEKIKGPDGKEVRAMSRFDIDMAKCMYCGLCSEPCPTNAIRHTKHFESSVAHLEHLLIRFVDPNNPVVPFKVKKDAAYDTVDYGSIAKKLYVDRAWDLPKIKFPEIPRKTGKKKEKVIADPFTRPLSERAKGAKGADPKRLAIILEEAMAGTDCGACQYPTCKEYSQAIARGECPETFRCEPGGTDSQIEAAQIMMVFKGVDFDKAKNDAEAKKSAIVAGGAVPAGQTPAAG